MKHLVHITPSFAPGGAQVRTVMLMNHFGRRYRHTVISLDDRLQAAARIAADVCADCVTFAKTSNPASMGVRLALKIRGLRPDAVLTYNWGSMDGAVAAALTGRPLVHTEDGFGPEEAAGQKRRRAWTRGAVLRAASRVVAPSMCLVKIMRSVWHLPEKMIAYIPNGIDTSRFGPAASSSSDELVIGTVGHLRPEKNIGLLLRSAAGIAGHRAVRVMILGDGPERGPLEALSHDLGIASRVEFLGWHDNVSQIYRKFHIFALTSSTEQMPLSVLEAMASGLPLVSTDVGDVRLMVAEANRPFIVPLKQFAATLGELAFQPDLQCTLGAANRAHCAQAYSMDRMFTRYESLYEGVLDGVRAAAPAASPVCR